jgi:hypothetical protein
VQGLVSLSLVHNEQPPIAPHAPRNISATRKNRVKYVIWQTIYGGFSVGSALGHLANGSGSYYFSSILFSTAGVIPIHTYLSGVHGITDAQLHASRYYPGAAISSAYLMAGMLTPQSQPFIKKGAALSLAAYPLGVWYTYRRGKQLQHNPGRALLETNLGVAGFVTGIMIKNAASITDRSEGNFIILASGVSATIGSRWYRPTDVIPEGIAPGIILQMGVGALISRYSVFKNEDWDFDKSTGRALAFSSAGLLTGLITHYNSESSMERSFYDFLGGASGALLGAGLQYSVKAQTNDIMITTTILGYGITHWFTRTLQENNGKNNKSNVSLQLLPVPWISKQADGTYNSGLQVAGWQVTF